MLLLIRVRNCSDDAEYEMYKQQWDTINRPQCVRQKWSQRQEEVIGAVAFAVSVHDVHCLRRVVTTQTTLKAPKCTAPRRFQLRDGGAATTRSRVACAKRRRRPSAHRRAAT